MSTVQIDCPHCGFSKNVASDKIPEGIKKIKCPKCQQHFPFEKDEQDFSFESVGKPAAAPQGGPARPQVAAASKFCPTCGQQVNARAEICPGCGVRVAPPANAVNKVALLLITFFLGGIGGHKFYQRKYGLGVLYLLFFWTYIPSLVALVEFIIYAFKSEADLQQSYPEVGGAGALVALIAIPVVLAIIGILAAIAIPQFAAYRQRAYDAMAQENLQACRTEAEVYYADFGSYPVDSGQLQCQASQNVVLYYLAFGPNENQIISFHKNGRSAFLLSSADTEAVKEAREEIEQEIVEKFGPGALEASFHFMQ